MKDLPEYVLKNRALWDKQAEDYAGAGQRSWAQESPSWGIWGIPEAEAGVLPPVLAGVEAIELGCGTAYISAWMARRGARPVGIDSSEAQLATARRLQREHGLDFPLIHGIAESVPYPDASFDLAISEYGASLWADPVSMGPRSRAPVASWWATGISHQFIAADSMRAEYGRGLRSATATRIWPLPGRMAGRSGVEFHLPHGGWIRLLREAGSMIEDLIELRPAADATTRYRHIPLEWARQWPCEELWKARKLT